MYVASIDIHVGEYYRIILNPQHALLESILTGFGYGDPRVQ